MSWETRDKITEQIIVVYKYGSTVYGTHNHKTSDNDYIVVVKGDGEFSYDVKDIDDYHVYSESAFIKKIEEHHIAILECIFQHEHDPYVKHFRLDKEKLRRSISAISSNSFVKCKKKLAEDDVYIGLKSLFHSLRILMFGIQIAKTGKIYDYSCANFMLPSIM